APKLHALRIRRFSHTISVKHHDVTRLEHQGILVIASLRKHSQRLLAILDEAHVALRVQQQRWIVPSIRIRQRAIRGVENRMKRSDKLVSFDRLPEQVVYLRERDV